MTARQDYPANNYPFSSEMCLFIDNHPEFLRALKLSNTNRFQYIPLIFTSSTPNTHPLTKDQVIGMWYIDKNNYYAGRHPFFKQDFIINKNSLQIEYIVFASRAIMRRESSPYIKSIDDFFQDYGQGGQYYHNENRWDHYYNTVNDLPDEPRLRRLATDFINQL